MRNLQQKKKGTILLTNITFCPNGQNSREVFGVGPALLQLDLRVVLDGMSISQHPPAPDDEPAAARAVLPFALPWEGKIGFRVHAEHLHHGVHGRYHPHHLLPLRRRLRALAAIVRDGERAPQRR